MDPHFTSQGAGHVVMAVELESFFASTRTIHTE